MYMIVHSAFSIIIDILPPTKFISNTFLIQIILITHIDSGLWELQIFQAL